ncbi:MAG: GNAT family N-acetyltransferase [Bacteroides sp.]|nr:GNAT family N-acetyltransferase [Bacteroides sp.]
MEELVLIIPSEQNAAQIADYRRELLESGSSMDGCGSLRRAEDPLEWLKEVEMNSKEETCAEKLVPATQFIYVRKSDNKIVGMIQLRHCLNDYLRQFSGHIGYSVRPSERRKGYAKRMLGECLLYAGEMGLDRVMVSCIDTNEASRRTILSNGGKYFETAYEPEREINLEKYWIDVKRRGTGL